MYSDEDDDVDEEMSEFYSPDIIDFDDYSFN